MSDILFHYERVNVTSWAYLSSLLMIALFFKFSRFWSVRNLDLVGLIMLAPGLLLVQHGLDHAETAHANRIEHIGYVWLFVVGAFLLVRMLMDSTMVRRPHLEPNMTAGGLTFLAISMFLFLMANVVNGRPGEGGLQGAMAAESLIERQHEQSAEETFARYGPGLRFISVLPHISTRATARAILGSEVPPPAEPPVPDDSAEPPPDDEWFFYELTAKVMAIMSHLAIVLGMVAIGAWHFDNGKSGIAAATLYLLLPYTALWTGHVIYVLPAALLVWAVAAYRRPLVAGLLVGLAISVIYYPLYLLPLWISFYWGRGRRPFWIGVLVAIAVVVASLAFTSADIGEFWAQVKSVFGFRLPTFKDEHLGGIWQHWNKMYRIPLLAAFLCLSIGLAFWPAQKNLSTLLSCTAAVMLGTQFWHPTTSGLAMAWYLPLTLLTIFRPNLEDRVAESTAVTRWFL